MEHQIAKPERILKLLQIIPRNCLNKLLTNVRTERWNSREEFHGKNDQSRKNLDKLTIYVFLERTLWAFRW